MESFGLETPFRILTALLFHYESCEPFAMAETPWHPVIGNSGAIALELETAFIPPDEHFSLMLSVGIRYGTVMNNGMIQQVKYAGGAKVLTVV